MNSIQRSKSASQWVLAALEKKPFASMLFTKGRKKILPAIPFALLGVHIINNFSQAVESVVKIASQALFKLSPALFLEPALNRQLPPQTNLKNMASLAVRSKAKLACFGDLPVQALEKIALNLGLPDLAAFGIVSKQTALATAAPQVWQMWSMRFELAIDPLEACQVMRPLVRYFTVDDKNQIFLRHKLADNHIAQALLAYPKPCFIMHTGTRPKFFHFFFRSLEGKIELYRDVAVGCPLSERYIKASKIINDERYRQIKVLNLPALQP